LYEAEIYDPVIAEKIRNGLIQHVSVGADYDALDVVDAKIPHGLSNPELSLVAIPGIPETNIQVLEHLRESLPVDIPVPSDSKDGIQDKHDHFVGDEKMDEKEMDKIAEKVALKIGELNSLEVEKLKIALLEAQKKFLEIEGKVKIAQNDRDDVNGKLAVANKSVEDLKKLMPGVDLLANPPVLMAVSEHIAILERHLPSVMAERSSLGLQRHAQEMRGSIMQAKEKLRVK
jgi:hypothetical protein